MANGPGLSLDLLTNKDNETPSAMEPSTSKGFKRSSTESLILESGQAYIDSDDDAFDLRPKKKKKIERFEDDFDDDDFTHFKGLSDFELSDDDTTIAKDARFKRSSTGSLIIESAQPITENVNEVTFMSETMDVEEEKEQNVTLLTHALNVVNDAVRAENMTRDFCIDIKQLKQDIKVAQNVAKCVELCQI